MHEYTPYVTLSYALTVPVPCPPCSVSYMISFHQGLVLSDCSITFTSDDPPEAIKNLRVRAVQVAGSYTRWSAIRLNSSSTETMNVTWNGKKLSEIPVSFCFNAFG